MVKELLRESFEPHLNTMFEVDFGNGPEMSTLIDVRSVVAPSEDHQGRQPWSLLFRTASHEHYRQATYPIRHPELGEMALFLVPIGPDKDGMRYEAVFS